MKKRINICLIIIIIVMVVGASTVLIINNFDKKEETKVVDQKDSKNNPYNYDYRYILSYDYLTVNYFIYLLEDNNIKVVSKEKVYEICSDENCIKETDDIKYEEVDINLNESALNIARNIISSFFASGNTRELDLKSYNLDAKVRLVLDGIIENNNDKISLSNDLKIETKDVKFNNKKGDVEFTHSYSYVVESDNEIVNKIATHINKIVQDDFKQIENDSKNMLEYLTPDMNNSIGVELKLSIEAINDNEISISYITTGGMGGVSWLNVHGYVYNVTTGEVKEYLDNKKDKAYEAAIESFKKMDIYVNEDAREELLTNYEEIIKSEMFKVGNFYVTDDKIIFAIDGSLLGYPSAICKSADIEIDRNDNF